MSDNLTGLAGPLERPNLHHTVIHPATGEKFPPHPMRGWAVNAETMARLIGEDRILWSKNAGGRPRIKRFQAEAQSETTGFSTILNAPTNEAGTRELNDIFGKKVFAFPKPSKLISALIEQTTEPGDLILDAFAGSGTTGVAALQTGELRKFILVEMDKHIAASVTAERLELTINGYSQKRLGGKGDLTDGLGGGFRFCTLGEPLFDADGNVSPEVTFPDLAAHVFFCETGSPIPRRAESASPLIGTFQDRAIYLLHASGSMGVADERAGNVLTAAMLETLPAPSADFTGTRVVYAEGCTLPDDRLAAAGVTFKQVPYQIEGL